MKTQSDAEVRIVSLSNLYAMCDHVSGCMCHKFKVSNVSRSRVHVTYSNENEYAAENPITAVYPCFPGDEPDNPYVVLQLLRVINDSWDGEGWHAFTQLEDCPRLSRMSPDSNDWKTEYQWLVEKHPQYLVSSSWDKGGCVQTWHCDGKNFRSYQEAEAYAVEQIKAK